MNDRFQSGELNAKFKKLKPHEPEPEHRKINSSAIIINLQETNYVFMYICCLRNWHRLLRNNLLSLYVQCTCTLLFCGQINATFFSVYKQISLQSFMFIQNLGKSNRRRGTSLEGTLYCKYFYMYFYLIFQCRQQLKKQKKHIFYNVCLCHEQFMFGTFYFAMGLSFILWKFINFQTCRVHLWVVIADGLSRWVKLQNKKQK